MTRIIKTQYTGLADFFANASMAEKKRVIKQATIIANKSQKDLMAKAEKRKICRVCKGKDIQGCSYCDIGGFEM